jgi:hypothetical protein
MGLAENRRWLWREGKTIKNRYGESIEERSRAALPRGPEAKPGEELCG